MYFDWKPGVRLLCVDATPPPLAALWFFRNWIRAGQVYTLRQLIIPLPGGPNPGPGVYLAEIRNPIEPEGGFEYGYLAYRFEKLEDLPARAEHAKTALQRARWPEVPLRPEDPTLRPLRASGGHSLRYVAIIGQEDQRKHLTRFAQIVYTDSHAERTYRAWHGRCKSTKHSGAGLPAAKVRGSSGRHYL